MTRIDCNGQFCFDWNMPIHPSTDSERWKRFCCFIAIDLYSPGAQACGWSCLGKCVEDARQLEKILRIHHGYVSPFSISHAASAPVTAAETQPFVQVLANENATRENVLGWFERDCENPHQSWRRALP